MRFFPEVQNENSEKNCEMVSGREKKQQLKKKRAAKKEKNTPKEPSAEVKEDRPASAGTSALASQYLRESNIEVDLRRNRADEFIDVANRTPAVAFATVDLGFPKRPDWDRSTSPELLAEREQSEFNSWLQGILDNYSLDKISPFERNIEVWRQLWRALEKGDVVLLAADIRNPLLHIPIALYRYVTEELKLPLLICLTKVDLVSDEHVYKWLVYLKQSFPDAEFETFSTRSSKTCDGGVASRRRCLKKVMTNKDKEMITREARKILDICICLANHVSDIPTISLIGQPNTGKSSLLNSIIGEKVVSVSRSCGHTKHWQTHFVEVEGARIARLCDSPGLIFPVVFEATSKLSPRAVFECSGLYPIPQIRETYTAIRFLAEHLPLEKLYRLVLDEDDYGSEWSAHAYCGALADQKGYSLARSSGPDMHRAGLEIIRDCVDGYLILAFQPPETNLV